MLVANLTDAVPSSFDDLLCQASNTANVLFQDAVDSIDSHMGEGFARANPGLVGDFMKAAMADYCNSTGMKVYGHYLPKLIAAVENIGSAIDEVPNR